MFTDLHFYSLQGLYGTQTDYIWLLATDLAFFLNKDHVCVKDERLVKVIFL